VGKLKNEIVIELGEESVLIEIFEKFHSYKDEEDDVLLLSWIIEIMIIRFLQYHPEYKQELMNLLWTSINGIKNPKVN
jgi:hypothetical protein